MGKAAGVSRGTPCYFFGSKQGLYRVVVERMVADVREFIERTFSWIDQNRRMSKDYERL